MSGTSLYSGELLGKGKADILLKFSFMASQKMEMSLKIKCSFNNMGQRLHEQI